MQTSATHPSPASQSAVSASAFAVLAALMEARTGQQLANYRSWRLDTALKPLLRERGLDTLDQLVFLLLDGQDHQIGARIVDAVVNSESSFFRDQTVFDQIGEAFVARAAAEPRRIRRPRIWCAGCSSGQETLSLAMMFAELAESRGLAVPEIIGTDVSEGVLNRARSARYTQFEIQRGLPIRRMMRWFENEGDDWVAKPELLRMIQYRRHNLVADRPPPGRFDAVLCRNVLLYLAPATKTRVFHTLAEAVVPGGLLVLGAGETVVGQTGLFAPSRTLRGLYHRSEGDDAAMVPSASA